MTKSYVTKCLRTRFSIFRFLLLLTFALVFFLFPQNVYSLDTTLAWDPNSEENLDGYRIFYREDGQSYDYEEPAWEGSETTCTIYNLDDNTTYYFVARVFDTEGSESGDSNEACYQPFEPSIVIDNGDPETSSTGTWSVSSASGWYGTNSVWSRDGSIYRWTFSPSVSGYYDVAMWWTTWSSRSTNVPVIIEHAAGATEVNINQQLNGSQWNSLDDYFFESGSSYNVTITAQPGPSSTCADAVRFNFIQSNDPPTAIIDYITPNPAQVGEDVTFSGYGEDPDGSITGYSWKSNIDGWLSDLSSFTTSSLTEGTHTISFKVQDDEGIWSEAVTQALVVSAIPTEIIIDNRDAETSQTGTWEVSGATDPYRADSVYGRDGATFTWHLTPSQSGIYEVSMRWTAWASRSLNVPVDIEHSDGVATVYVDQQENGGQWNVQGQYYFESGTTYDIIIISQPYPSSTCADAVRFNFIQSNDPPTAIIDYITPNPAQVGEDVTFSGYGEDPDGSITGYSWKSNIDGWLSDLSSFTTSSLTEGTHTISFKVQDDEGIWSEAVTQALVVSAIPTEIIIDNRDAETSQTGTWKVSGATDPYRADSVYGRDGATFTWHLTPSQSGIYEVSMWWTAWASRSLNVPVDIEHSDGVATVYVDQQENGGQWNVQGQYYFESGTTYDIIVISQPYPSSTCADAIKVQMKMD